MAASPDTRPVWWQKDTINNRGLTSMKLFALWLNLSLEEYYSPSQSPTTGLSHSWMPLMPSFYKRRSKWTNRLVLLNPNHPTHVCKLQKSLYDLKQAPRAWYQALHDYLLFIDFTSSHADHSLFIRHDSNTVTYLLVYVDDILLTSLLGNLSPHIFSTQ